MRPYRSMLFLPGHRPSWVEKAIRLGADAIVLDLEDSVPESEKAEARSVVAESIGRAEALAPGVGVLVRVHGLQTGQTGFDLEAVVVDGLDGVFAPKVEDAADALRFDTLVEWFERRHGVSGVELAIPMETARALSNVEEIATASTRIGAILGSTAEHADVAREIGFEWTPGGLETIAHRSRAARLTRREGPRHDRTVGADGRPRWRAGLLRPGATARLPRADSDLPLSRPPSSTRRSAHRPTTSSSIVARRRVRGGGGPGGGAVVYRGRHIDKAHLHKAVEWLARAEEIAAFDTGLETT